MEHEEFESVESEIEEYGSESEEPQFAEPGEDLDLPEDEESSDEEQVKQNKKKELYDEMGVEMDRNEGKKQEIIAKTI